MGRGSGDARWRLPQDAGLATAREHLPVGVRLVEERLSVVRTDRGDEETRERGRIEVLVRRPCLVLASHPPPGAHAELDRLDRDASRGIRVGHTRAAQRGTRQRRVADEPLDEVGERHSGLGSATTQRI